MNALLIYIACGIAWLFYNSFSEYHRRNEQKFGNHPRASTRWVYRVSLFVGALVGIATWPIWLLLLVAARLAR
jgi:hypothetical protein